MAGVRTMSCHDFQHNDPQRINIGSCCAGVEFWVGKTFGCGIEESLLKDPTSVNPSCSCLGARRLVGSMLPAWLGPAG